jgi:cysteine-rich repeat protein
VTTSTTGSTETCNLRCEYDVISQCRTGDSCCPATCNNNSDQDCSTTCNDGKIDNGETCEAGTETPCPGSCDDRKPCTVDQTIGSAANCNVICTHTQITQPRGGDGCCPDGATANSDSDCSTRCGNRVVENSEQCDDGNETAGDGCVACKSEDQQQVCLATMGRDDDCARCSCSKCQPQSLGCYGTGSREDVEACDELVQCQRRTSCGNPSCFCGDVSLFACLAGASDGPCKQQILGAAKTSVISEISARSTDSAYPLGRANALDGCSRMNCAAECAQ